MINPDDAIKGLLAGAFLGGGFGLGLCVWVIPGDLWFPGDTVLFGALLGAAAGAYWGDDLFEWIRENARWLFRG